VSMAGFLRAVIEFAALMSIVLTPRNYIGVIISFLSVGAIFQRIFSECEARTSNDPLVVHSEVVGPRLLSENGGLTGIEWRRRVIRKDDPISLLVRKIPRTLEEKKAETIWNFLKGNGQYLECTILIKSQIVGKPIVTWQENENGYYQLKPDIDGTTGQQRKVQDWQVPLDGEEVFDYKGKTATDATESRWETVTRYALNDQHGMDGTAVEKTFIKQGTDRYPQELTLSKYQCFRCMAMVDGETRCKNIINMSLARRGSIYCGVHITSNRNTKASGDWEIDRDRETNPSPEVLARLRNEELARQAEERRQRRARRAGRRTNPARNADSRPTVPRRRRARTPNRRSELEENMIKF